MRFGIVVVNACNRKTTHSFYYGYATGHDIRFEWLAIACQNGKTRDFEVGE
jgi:hypothetical protein